MWIRSACLLLILIPTISLGEVPESIVGDWKFDGDRMPCGEADPEHERCPNPWKGKDPCVAQSKRNSPLALTITKSTIDSADGSSLPYEVVGGNSRTVIIESSKGTGSRLVSSIILMEGGIAIQSIDCHADPEWCDYVAPDGERLDETVVSKYFTPPAWVYFYPPDRKSCRDGLDAKYPTNQKPRRDWVDVKGAAGLEHIE